MGRMAMKNFEKEGLKHFRERGMTARLWRDEASGLLHVLAKPDIGQAESRLHFLRPHVNMEHSPWFNHWWAKLLRQIHSRWKILPYWLRELVWAQHVHYSESLESLPTNVLERIRIMRHYLMFRNVNPTKVAIGAKALRELREEVIQGYSDYYPITFGERGWCGECIFGLEIQINPFLAEDAVIVC